MQDAYELSFKVENALEFLKRSGKNSMMCGTDYKQDWDLWVTGAYRISADWLRACQGLENKGYTASYFYMDGVVGTLISYKEEEMSYFNEDYCAKFKGKTIANMEVPLDGEGNRRQGALNIFFTDGTTLKIDAAVEHEKVVREVNLIANCN